MKKIYQQIQQVSANEAFEKYFILSCLMIGSVLRLIWVGDMEWKVDEQDMYVVSQRVANGAIAWPDLGMASGGGMRNPGFSMWLFSAIAFFAKSPIAMVYWVMASNVVAIWLFYFFIKIHVPKAEQKVWQYGLATASVSILAVLFSRKLWAQDILPIFSFFIIASYAYRKNLVAAFSWGVFGALIGQIHMSGFFFAFGLVAYTLYVDIKNKQFGNLLKSWMGWFFGSVVGSLSLLPWLKYMLFERAGGSNFYFWEIFTFKFYSQWLGSAFGINIKEYLQSVFTEKFISLPQILGVDTYLMAACHLFLLGMALYFLLSFIYFKIRKSPKKPVFRDQFSLTVKYLMIMALPVGITMTLSGFSVHAHYLIVIFPFNYIWLALIYYKKPMLLQGAIVAQLLITITFLVFVHQNQGVVGADYGKAFNTQNYQPPCLVKECLPPTKAVN